MRRSTLSLAASGILVLAACTPSEVVVNAEIDQPADPETGTLALQNVVVELVPFDRDEVFDSLSAEASRPEPEIPPELEAAREATSEAYEQWQTHESRWNTLRDTLQTLSEELEQYNRGEGRYVTLYQEWQDLDAELQRITRQKDQAFARFDSLTRANLAESERIRIERENWADEAFADIGEVFEARLDAAGREILTDTTSADGIARFPSVDAGEWWVHARWETGNSELYWNIPVSVPKGEVAQVRLTRENAEVRPNL